MWALSIWKKSRKFAPSLAVTEVSASVMVSCVTLLMFTVTSALTSVPFVKKALSNRLILRSICAPSIKKCNESIRRGDLLFIFFRLLHHQQSRVRLFYLMFRKFRIYSKIPANIIYQCLSRKKFKNSTIKSSFKQRKATTQHNCLHSPLYLQARPAFKFIDLTWNPFHWLYTFIIVLAATVSHRWDTTTTMTSPKAGTWPVRVPDFLIGLHHNFFHRYDPK